MNRTKIEWALNPDGSPGYTWNPITGCLNGCPYCYARKLANGRLRSRYLANQEGIAELAYLSLAHRKVALNDPFYPRFWPERLDITESYWRRNNHRGVFVCDMSDLFGIGIPEKWTGEILGQIKECQFDRFYLLTKQPQNLIKWSPFPDNCYVGITVTNDEMFWDALRWLHRIQAKVKFLSVEPYLREIRIGSPTLIKLDIPDWVIIGSQTKPYKPPKIELVRKLVETCDTAGIPVFLKENLRSLFAKENNVHPDMVGLRQELPR